MTPPIEPVVTTPENTVEIAVTTQRGVARVVTRRPRVEAVDGGVIVDHVSVQINASTPLEPQLSGVQTSPPTDLAAAATSDGVLVTWTDSVDGDIVGVRLYRSLTSGHGYALVHVAAPGVESWLDTDVTDGVTYYYRADAIDNLGIPSFWTSEASAVADLADALLYLLTSSTQYLAYSADGDPLVWRE